MNSANEIHCLGIDGHIYSIKRYAELECNENGYLCPVEVIQAHIQKVVCECFVNVGNML